MLEYLQLRPEDSVLFQSGAWRYIVLDEAHTYSGAQGIEVSMLIRRVKHRLEKSPDEVQCIATSATLTNDDASEAAKFARNLFGESIGESDIIFGDPDHDYAKPDSRYSIDARAYLHPEFDELINKVRQDKEHSTESIAEQMDSIGLLPSAINWSELATKYIGNPRGFVFEIMRNNGDLIDLRKWLLEKDTRSLTDVAGKFFATRLRNKAEHEQALYRLVELGALARPKEDTAPLLPARYHMFMRSPQGIWLCFNPDCDGKQLRSDADWSKVFSMRRETCDACGCKVFPISVCRDCGQVFLKTIYINGRYFGEIPNTPNDLTPKHDVRYLLWQIMEENRALGADDEVEEGEEGNDQTQSKYDTQDVRICLRCGEAVRGGSCLCVADADDRPVHCSLNLLLRDEGKNGRVKLQPYAQMNECPRCRSKARDDTDQATAINLSGNVPLSILT